MPSPLFWQSISQEICKIPDPTVDPGRSLVARSHSWEQLTRKSVLSLSRCTCHLNHCPFPFPPLTPRHLPSVCWPTLALAGDQDARGGVGESSRCSKPELQGRPQQSWTFTINTAHPGLQRRRFCSPENWMAVLKFWPACWLPKPFSLRAFCQNPQERTIEIKEQQ